MDYLSAVLTWRVTGDYQHQGPVEDAKELHTSPARGSATPIS
jgi:hypothetical protein